MAQYDSFRVKKTMEKVPGGHFPILRWREKFVVHGAVTMTDPKDRLTKPEIALLLTSLTVMIASFVALINSI